MYDAPDVDSVGVRDVEDEVGEVLERPAAKVWDLEFVSESERPGKRVLGEPGDRGFERVDEAQCGRRAGFVAVVEN